MAIQPGEAASDVTASMSTHSDAEFESAALDAIVDRCRSEWNNFYWVTFGRATSRWHYRAGAALPESSASTLQRFCDMTQQDQKSLIWHARRRWRETKGRVAHFFVRHVPNPDLSDLVTRQPTKSPIEPVVSDVPSGYEDWVFPDAVTALFFVDDPHDPTHSDPIAAAVLCFKREAAVVISWLSSLRGALRAIAANYDGHTRWTVGPSPVEAWLEARDLAIALFPHGSGLHYAKHWTPHDVATKHDKLVEIENASNTILSAVESRLRLSLLRRLDARCRGLNNEDCEHLWIAKAFEHGRLHPRMLAAALGSHDAVQQELQRVEPLLSNAAADLMDFLAGCYVLGAEEGLESLSVRPESASVLALEAKLTPRGSGDGQMLNAMRVGAAMFTGDAVLYPDEAGERRGGGFTALCSCFRGASTSIAVDVCPRGKSVHLTWRFAAAELP